MSRPHPWEAIYPPGVDWGAPIVPITLPALLDAAVARFSDLPALRYRGLRLTFNDFGRRVDRLAAGLIAEGLAPGQAVGLLLPNTPAHPIAFFAVLRAGGRVVHLTPLDPLRAIWRKLADSGADWVISTDLLPTGFKLQAGLERQAAGARVFLARDAAWDTGAPPGWPDAAPQACWPKVDPSDIALLQYTGGTTGLPRAACLSHANLTAAVEIYRVWNAGQGRDMSPSDRVICVLPLFHIYALTTILLRALSSGAEILLRARFDTAAVLADIEGLRATVFPGVPTMWTALAAVGDIGGRDLSSLRIVSSGGAPLPQEIATRLEALTGLRLGGGWGMTETSPAGTNLIPGDSYGPGEIGVPLPGIEMRIVALDDPGQVLPAGETGEIAIRGPNVMAGYWQRPEESTAAFADGFFLTDDVGHRDAQGRFFLVDRKKDMIISGGFNVYPRVIEDAIYEHPDVAEAAVIGVADPYRGQAAKAFVALRPGAAPLTLEALRVFLSERIGRHELPTALELRDSLPKTAVGKLSRRELAEP